MREQESMSEQEQGVHQDAHYRNSNVNRSDYMRVCYRFLESVLSFFGFQLNFQKPKTTRRLLFTSISFDCSSYDIWTRCQTMSDQ